MNNLTPLAVVREGGLGQRIENIQGMVKAKSLKWTPLEDLRGIKEETQKGLELRYGDYHMNS